MTDWWGRLAGTLAEVAERAGSLADRVAADWADDHGRERAERLAALRRELQEEAAAAQRVADRADHHTDDDAARALAMRIPGLLSSGRAVDRHAGVRLPGIEVERVDDDPGVRLPDD